MVKKRGRKAGRIKESPVFIISGAVLLGAMILVSSAKITGFSVIGAEGADFNIPIIVLALVGSFIMIMHVSNLAKKVALWGLVGLSALTGGAIVGGIRNETEHINNLHKAAVVVDRDDGGHNEVNVGGDYLVRVPGDYSLRVKTEDGETIEIHGKKFYQGYGKGQKVDVAYNETRNTTYLYGHKVGTKVTLEGKSVHASRSYSHHKTKSPSVERE